MITNLLCTVGTSLLFNLNSVCDSNATEKNGIRQDQIDALKQPIQNGDVESIASILLDCNPNAMICGAEINSIASMETIGYCADNCQLFFLHSATPDGQLVASVLSAYYGRRAEPCEVIGLQDKDTRMFRTIGLRNLAKEMCKIIRNYGVHSCGINATGGYKAQIGIAVVLGQATKVPVYYKHDRFDEIIAFPPMPVSLDFDLWMQINGILADLAANPDVVSLSDYDVDEDCMEKLESLIDRVIIGGVVYIELSAVGQIFHDAFRDRFRARVSELLPPDVAVSLKKAPSWESSGHMQSHPEVMGFMKKLTSEVGPVVRCYTSYYNPDLPKRTNFRLKGDELIAVYSNGSYTVNIIVESSATTMDQKAALAAWLNDWLHS